MQAQPVQQAQQVLADPQAQQELAQPVLQARQARNLP